MRIKQPCTSCGAGIFMAITGNSKRIPIDWEPAADGNLEIIDGAGLPFARYAGQDDLFGDTLADGSRYKSHFATCPNADDHRTTPRKGLTPSTVIIDEAHR